MLAEGHLLLKQQYGFVAAAVFPPHMTIVGHLATTQGPTTVIEAYDAMLASYSPIRVVNTGMKRWGKGIAYDVDQLEDGSRNPAIVELFERSFAAVAPIRTIVGTDHLGGTPSAEGSRAHCTLAAQDLGERAELREEVFEYLDALGFNVRGEFLADTFTLYRFTSQAWDGRWWESMRWDLLKSWRLA